MATDTAAIWIILAVGLAILVSFLAFGWLMRIFPPKMGPAEAEGWGKPDSGDGGRGD